MSEKLTKQEKRQAFFTALLIVLFLLIIGLIIVFYEAPEKTGNSEAADNAAVLQAAAGLDEIRVRCDFDPDNHRITGTSEMQLTNTTGQFQPAVVLRSWTGAFLSPDTSPCGTEELFDRCYPNGFSAGGLQVDSVTINGSSVPFFMEDTAQTVLKVSADWQDGETLTLEISWQAVIPDCAGRFGYANGFWSLGNLFPIPALWQDGRWLTDEYLSIGDPFVSACANWQVALTAPAGYTAAATGYCSPIKQGNTTLWQWTAPAVRDFAVTLSRHYQEAARFQDGILLIARAGTRSHAKKILKYAGKALAVFNAHFGPYAYPTLTLAETGLAFNGMEYPRLAMIGTDAVAAGGSSLEYAVVHEVAHQWWYAMAGSDSVRQAWQDESLCQYSLITYLGDVYGPEARAEAAFSQAETALRITIPGNAVPGSPLDQFSTTDEYHQLVYQRGAALWLALENALGQEKLDSILKKYRDEFCFSQASRQELEELLQRETGESWTELITDYLDTCIEPF